MSNQCERIVRLANYLEAGNGQGAMGVLEEAKTSEEKNLMKGVLLSVLQKNTPKSDLKEWLQYTAI